MITFLGNNPKCMWGIRCTLAQATLVLSILREVVFSRFKKFSRLLAQQNLYRRNQLSHKTASFRPTFETLVLVHAIASAFADTGDAIRQLIVGCLLVIDIFGVLFQKSVRC